MPRIRAIKPDHFLDDRLAGLPGLTRWFYMGLCCIADREGRLEDNAKRIRAQVLPYDASEDAEAHLSALGTAGYIVRYSVGNQQLIQIVHFERDQRPNPKEAPSTLPPPPQGAEAGGTGSGPDAAPIRIEARPNLDSSPARCGTDPTSIRSPSSTLGREVDREEGKEGGPEEGKPSAVADGKNVGSPPRQRGRPPAEQHPETMALCRHLEARAHAWKPDARVDAQAKRSINGMDALLRIDRRDPAKVRTVIDWLFTGGYAPHNQFDWRPVTLSGASLRKHWDQIETLHDSAGGAEEEGEWNGR